MNVNTTIFRAYDIRGIYPEQINDDVAYMLGQAYAMVIKPEGEVMIGHDVRVHSEELKKKVIEGLVDAGINVVDVGMMTTDMLYFGVGKYGFAGGIQLTASHNPAEWHGAKMVRKNVVPMTLESGGDEIRDYILKHDKFTSKTKGRSRLMGILDEYCKYILGWVDAKAIKPMKVVYNPNFGYAGVVFERIVELGNLPLTLIPLNEKPDGTFPKGRPDPFVPENRPEFVTLVKEKDADLGIAWDGDADRVFFCTDGGLFVEPYYLNTILIASTLKKFPGEKIIYDPRYTWGLLDAIKSGGGEPVLVKVGHSYIKEAMRKENAAFAAESSGHTYYRDYWYSDCGMIPPMQIIEHLSKTNQKLSVLVQPVMQKYIISGEINQQVADKEEKYRLVEEKYKDAQISKLDGVTVEYPDFRFNIRPSNNEPLFRLNLEAKTKELMEQKRDEVLALIRS